MTSVFKVLFILLFSIGALADDATVVRKDHLIQSITFKDGYKITVKYDPKAHKISRVDKPNAHYRFWYNSKNLLVKAQNNEDVVELEYDAQNRISCIRRIKSKCVMIAYDNIFGKPNVLSYGSKTLFVTYNSIGNINNVWSASGYDAREISQLFNSLLNLASPTKLFSKE